jgi:hypothetical protein
MLRQTKDLKGFRLAARDGDLGKIKDFYFDDSSWTIRYLVADTGTWLPGRQVLVSPYAIKHIHSRPGKHVEVDLTKKQIEQSPSIETQQPVSRQFEIDYFQYFNWPTYWGGPWEWGPAPIPGGLVGGVSPSESTPSPPDQHHGDPHLRSASEVMHYSIQALDDQFGHIADLIFDDQTWAIRYLVADTRNWLPGKKVLLAPQWLAWMSWPEGRVYVDLDRDTVRRAPEYHSGQELDRDYEVQLFSHFGRDPYWEKLPAISATS